MTINSETRVAGPFDGNDSTVSFPFTFKVFDSADVRVVAETGAVETDLELGTDYTVALNADQNASPGGSVVLVAPLATGTRLTLTSALEMLQPVDLTNQGGFYPRVINSALDRLTILLQQLASVVSRTLKFPLSDGPVGDLPGRSARAGTVLAFDEATGEPVVGPDISSVNGVAGALAAVNTVANNIADVNTVADNIADVNTIGQNIADVNTVAANIADVNTVVDNIADVNTVADNIDDLSNFSGVYYGPSAANPTTRRDGTPLQVGDLYFNTVTNALRTYNGSAWRESVSGVVTVQNLSGDGVETEFQLDYAPESEVITNVFVGGVYQQKNTYALGGPNGDVLIFDVAPPVGTDNIEVVVSSLVPSDDKLRQELSIISVRTYTGAPDGVTSNQAGIVGAVQAALAAGADLYWPAGTYVSTANIPNFHDVRHTGSGVIKRGSDTFKILRRGDQLNKIYVSTTGTAGNDGLTADVPMPTIQSAVTTLEGYGPALDGQWEVLIAAGTYQEAVSSSVSLYSKNYITFRGPDVAGGTPTAILDGNGKTLLTGLSLGPKWRFRAYDIKAQNYAYAGLQAFIQCTAIFYNCHTSGCAEVGLNSEIQNRVWIYGGSQSNNDKHGVRFYSQSTGQMGRDPRTSSDPVCSNNGQLGVQIREQSNVRADYLQASGNSLAQVQVEGASRIHLVATALDNGVGVIATRGGNFLDDGVTYGAGITTRVKQQSGGFELSWSSAKAEHAISVSTDRITHTGSTSLTSKFTGFTLPAGWFDGGKALEIEIVGQWSTSAGNTGTVSLYAGPFLLTAHTSAAGSTSTFSMRATVQARSLTSQQVQMMGVDNNRTPVGLNSARTIDMSAALSLSVQAQLTAAADSIHIDYIKIRTVG